MAKIENAEIKKQVVQQKSATASKPKADETKSKALFGKLTTSAKAPSTSTGATTAEDAKVKNNISAFGNLTTSPKTSTNSADKTSIFANRLNSAQKNEETKASAFSPAFGISADDTTTEGKELTAKELSDKEIEEMQKNKLEHGTASFGMSEPQEEKVEQTEVEAIQAAMAQEGGVQSEGKVLDSFKAFDDTPNAEYKGGHGGVNGKGGHGGIYSKGNNVINAVRRMNTGHANSAFYRQVHRDWRDTMGLRLGIGSGMMDRVTGGVNYTRGYNQALGDMTYGGCGGSSCGGHKTKWWEPLVYGLSNGLGAGLGIGLPIMMWEAFRGGNNNGGSVNIDNSGSGNVGGSGGSGGKISTPKTSIESIKVPDNSAVLASNKETISQLKDADRSNYQDALKAGDKQFGQITKSIDAQNAGIIKSNQQLGQLDAEEKALATEEADTNAGIEKLDGEITSTEQAKQKQEDFKTQRTSDKEKYDKAATEADGKAKSLGDAINNIDSQITTLKTQLKTASTNEKDKNSAQNIQKQIDDLTKQKAENEKAKAEAEKTRDENKKMSDQAATDIKDAEASIEKINNEKISLDEAKADCTKKLEQLKARAKNVDMQQSTIETTRDALNDKIEECTDNREELEDAMNDLCEEMNDSWQENADTKTSYNIGQASDKNSGYGSIHSAPSPKTPAGASEVGNPPATRATGDVTTPPVDTGSVNDSTTDTNNLTASEFLENFHHYDDPKIQYEKMSADEKSNIWTAVEENPSLSSKLGRYGITSDMQ